ncbi:hypothetical protein ACVFYP_21940 [Roseomonas sp. F4]
MHDTPSQPADEPAPLASAKPMASLGEPHLFEGERELFDATLKSGRQHYQEFGMGGSTLQAVQGGFKRIVAVDTSAAWVEAARQHPGIVPELARGRVQLLHADIGPVGDWGRPTNPTPDHQWSNYLRAPWEAWARMKRLPDLVYVDGRFRVACCLSTALVVGRSPAVSRRLRLMLHDVSSNRPEYDVVLKAFDVCERVNRLCVMRLKPRQDPAWLMSTLLEAQFDPR